MLGIAAFESDGLIVRDGAAKSGKSHLSGVRRRLGSVARCDRRDRATTYLPQRPTAGTGDLLSCLSSSIGVTALAAGTSFRRQIPLVALAVNGSLPSRNQDRTSTAERHSLPLAQTPMGQA
jgi:hypothetical protein